MAHVGVGFQPKLSSQCVKSHSVYARLICCVSTHNTCLRCLSGDGCFLCVGADCLPGTDHSWADEPDATPEETPTACLPETESIQVSWYQRCHYLLLFWISCYCIWHPMCSLITTFKEKWWFVTRISAALKCHVIYFQQCLINIQC